MLGSVGADGVLLKWDGYLPCNHLPHFTLLVGPDGRFKKKNDIDRAVITRLVLFLVCYWLGSSLYSGGIIDTLPRTLSDESLRWHDGLAGEWAVTWLVDYESKDKKGEKGKGQGRIWAKSRPISV